MKMKYAIFYLIKGKAEIYHKNIIKNIAKISGEKYLIDNPLPSHITLKYTFDADKKQIKELEKIIGLFVKRQKKSKINIDGFNNFNKFVVYMDVKFSMEAKYVRNNLIKQIKHLSFIDIQDFDNNWKSHSTIGYGNSKKTFNLIWKYVQSIDKPNYDLNFDNITIMKKPKKYWKLHRGFKLK